MIGIPGRLFWKELRALVPWWAASTGALLLLWWLRTTESAGVLDDDGLVVVGVWAYGLGAVVLGAMVVGQEYSHNTLSAQLLQPLDRGRLLLAKAIPLAVLLAGLVAVATFSLEVNLRDGGVRTLTLAWIPAACAVCLTPWLTMISRSTLGGVVYSFLVPLLLFAAGGYLGLPQAAAGPVIVVLAGVALFLTARTFVRLEVTGTAHADLDLLGWFTGGQRRPRSSTRRSSVLALLTKELRLQQVTLVTAAAYAIVWMVIGLGTPWMRDAMPDNLRYAATMVFATLVSLLPGALVSAEERRFGTADWHVLLPTRSVLQWGLKVGVALTLSVGLAAGLPALLDALSPGVHLDEAFHPLLAVVLCVSAIYVSSLSTHGLHALLATAPAIALAVAGWLVMLVVTLWLATPFLTTLAEWLEPLDRVRRADPRLWSQLRMGVPLLSVGVLLVVLSSRNHVTTDRPRSRIYAQAMWIVVTAWGSALLLFLVDATRGMTLRPPQ